MPMKHIVVFLSVVLASLLTYAPAYSDELTYNFFDGTTLTLGGGADLNALADGKASCIIYSEKRLSRGAYKTTLQINYVADYSSLELARGIDVSAKATGWGASVNGAYSRKFNSSFSQNSATLVITATADYGPWGLEPGATLEPSALKSIQTPEEFTKKCGSYYVSTEWRGSSVSAVIHLDGISSSLRDAITTSIGASAKYGAVTGSLRVKFEEEIKRAVASRRVSVDVLALGGLGVEALEPVIALSLSGGDPLDQISIKLGEYVKSFTADSAVPYKYQLRPMSDFGLDTSAISPWQESNNNVLERIVENYRAADDDFQQLSQLKSGAHPLRPYVDSDFLSDASGEMSSISLDLDEYRHLYEICKTRKNDRCDSVPLYRKNYLVSMLNDPPKIHFDMLYLKPQEIKAVLNTDRSIRGSVAKSYSYKVPDMWGITLGVSGFKLVSKQMYFIHDDDGEWHPIAASQPALFAGIWYENSEPADFSSPKVLHGTYNGETAMLNYMSAQSGKCSGRFGVRYTNAAGQVFDIDLGHASWEVVNGKLIRKSIQIDANWN